MITHSKRLLRKVETYIKYISKPQKLWNGNPICPGLADYRHEIQVLPAVGNLEDQINQICWMMHPLNIPAVVIATGMPPTNLYDITDAALTLHPGIEIFVNDPNKKGKIKGVYTGFAHGWLIIIQRSDLLQKSQEKAKKQGYYTQKNQDE